MAMQAGSGAAGAGTKQNNPPSYLGPDTSVFEQLRLESAAMAQYATKEGMAVQPADLQLIHRLDCERPTVCGRQTKEVAELAATHGRLAEVVRPATPHTLALLAFPTGELRLPWLGNVRLVRMLVSLTAVLLPLFVVLAVWAPRAAGTIDGWFTDGSIAQRLARVLYLLIAAALGAVFAALRKAFRYIGNLSYDEKYESSYWIRVVQGTTSGLVLSVLLANLFFKDPSAGVDSATTTQFRITLPLLAFVGGFSEDLVFSILRRIIDALKTLVSGSLEDRVQDERNALAAESRLQGVAATQTMVKKLFDLKASIPATDTAAHAKIDEAIAQALATTIPPADTAPPETPPDDGDDPAPEPDPPVDPDH